MTELAGITFHPRGVADASSMLEVFAADGTAKAVHLCNSWTVVLADREPVLKAALTSPRAVNLVDGIPLSRHLRRATGDPAPASRGPDLFKAVLVALYRHGYRQTLLGGDQETVDGIHAVLAHNAAPGDGAEVNSIVPPYQVLSETVLAAYVEQVARTRPHFVWVGLGTPKQDIAVDALAERIGVPCVAVGAAFQFLAGNVAEAPALLQGSGFEWLYRLWKEPRRLWRRYLFGNARFLLLIARERRTRTGRSTEIPWSR